MATEDEPPAPLKVFLWATPRSLSTTFLKCMTFVPETEAWHEPYFQMGKFSLDDDPEYFGPFKEIVETCGGQTAVEKINSGFDASDKTIDWLKEQLEGDFPGKKMVFVKDMGISICRPSPPLFDKIPKGYRHTFIMRHPSKKWNLQSVWKFHKCRIQFMKSFRQPRDQIRPFQYLNELWKYVKAEGLEARPIIIDADDLLRHPKEVLEAYCKELGIPFTEDLLTWEAGHDVMMNQWVVPKQTLLTYEKVGALIHKGTFESTGFTRQVKPEADNQKSTPESGAADCPPDVLADIQEIVDELLAREVPYYEEMYAERLVVDVGKK